MYSDAVVTERGRGNDSYFGKKIRKTSNIEKYLHLFDLIQHHSHRLSADSPLAEDVAVVVYMPDLQRLTRCGGIVLKN